MSGDNSVQGKLDDISWMKDRCNAYNDYDLTAALYSDNSHFSAQSTAMLIYCTYLLLNILILTLTVLYLGKIFTWIERPQHKYLKDLYNASATVLAFINLVTLVSDITLYTVNYQNYYLWSLDFIIKFSLVALIFVLGIVVSCFYTCKYSDEWKIMHALALCQIIWFVHRLATDAILSVIAFIIAPAQTLGLITLLLFTVICAILFVSSLFQKFQACCSCSSCTCERSTLPTIFCLFLIATCTVGLVFTITLLFISLVDNGLQSAGMGGFVLSLIPPTAVFVIGLCVNRKIAVNFYRRVLTSSSTIGSPNMNEADTPANGNVNNQADETTPLIQRSVAINMEESEEEH